MSGAPEIKPKIKKARTTEFEDYLDSGHELRVQSVHDALRSAQFGPLPVRSQLVDNYERIALRLLIQIRQVLASNLQNNKLRQVVLNLQFLQLLGRNGLLVGGDRSARGPCLESSGADILIVGATTHVSHQDNEDIF